MIRKDWISNVERFISEEKEDEKASSTIKHYRHVLTEFTQSLPDKDITKPDLIEYKQTLINRFKPSTVNNYLIIINKYIRYLEIMDDPDYSKRKLKKHESKNVLRLMKVQVKASIDDVLEPVDFKRMLRMAKKLGQMDIYYIMKIFAYTGIRAEELKVFTVENIQKNYIQVSNKGKTRNIILRSDLRRELLHYAKDSGIESGTIFPGKIPGKMLNPSTIYKRLKKLGGKCRGINLNKIHPHSFRHLFAIQFISEGGELSELSDILGHSNIQTTTIYTRTSDATKKKHLEALKY